MPVKRYYRSPGLQKGAQEVILGKIKKESDTFDVKSLLTERCFYVDFHEKNDESMDDKFSWLFATPFEESNVVLESALQCEDKAHQLLFEIGPRLNFSTAFSTNAVSICQSIGLDYVTRVEYSVRYLITFNSKPTGSGDSMLLTKDVESAILNCLHDRMTQCRYLEPITTFSLDIEPEDVFTVDILGEGISALDKANTELGLAFDAWDLDYYTKLFRDQVKRNPTSVECFDLAQSNSEHSRHWFFKGRMVIDGEEHQDSLFQMVMNTQKFSNDNNVIKFSDNSSAIKGFSVSAMHPRKTSEPSAFEIDSNTHRHILFTAETHNFPTGVAPFPGATTGTGGRIRDVQATGRGAHAIAGTAGYSFGNLNIPGYTLPWEDESFDYPGNFASPLSIAVEASNGASDYGNKFGEPVIAGFSRSFGMKLSNGERREWVKPIMFSAGIGSLDAGHIKKFDPEIGMDVVKVGGPVYRIGVGGGAASSIQVQGDNVAELDFGAVQRGDAEMEQKMNRVIRGCIEMGEDNPICSLHDQGAGGNGNVLKEISEPSGAEIHVEKFQLGDPTLSVLEIWGAEYQESNALLVRPEHHATLAKIGMREKCPVSFVGKITGDGKIRLVDNRPKPESEKQANKKRKLNESQYPVDLELEHVLASMPRKVFDLKRAKPSTSVLSLPQNLTVKEALDRVLRLPSVASKRYLTNKVDRSVTGLVAQQQCVGPLHTPLADVGVISLSYFDTVGSATAIGEQPIKGLIDAGCGARMTVGEALTNLVWAPISDIKDVKCSGNWMWAAKLPGEGAALVDACEAMCKVMTQLGVAVDGGKDSLSMAARVGKDTIKAPGALVVSTYAPCPDITKVVTPDLKCPSGQGELVYVPVCSEKHRMGGSALAQCYKQLGETSPDLDHPDYFVKIFNVTQRLIKERKISSGHDVSDGGLITCILEMGFAGNCGIDIDLPFEAQDIDVLFAEELGFVMEVDPSDLDYVMMAFSSENITCVKIGQSKVDEPKVSVKVNGKEVFSDDIRQLRDVWEETSVQLERYQTNPLCAQVEAEGLKLRSQPPYKLAFDCDANITEHLHPKGDPPKVGVIREEGSNGDREMVAAFKMAGFEVWDINMQDLCSSRISLDKFRGIVFVGGFSFADVCGSAKGWAATLKFNSDVRAQFEAFYARSDTFSLGVCNGCQLMALLGWVAPTKTQEQGVLLTHNNSERFESRFTTVSIKESPAIMFKGMEGSRMGIWVAHGEGRILFKTDAIKDGILDHNLAPLRYVDDDGEPTEVYPLNPNGSPLGIGGLCSRDGRHLAMMPHPERCVLPWQWPWMPSDWKHMKTSPWLRMFTNAYKWCLEN